MGERIMKKDKVTIRLISVKICPIFKTKCKMDRCAFYKKGAHAFCPEQIKEIISKDMDGNKAIIKYLVKGEKRGWSGGCVLREEAEVSVHERITIYGEPKIEEETECDVGETKLKPWWKFW